MDAIATTIAIAQDVVCNVIFFAAPSLLFLAFVVTFVRAGFKAGPR